MCVLPAGEYVAAEKIEASYKKNMLVEQIWVYGNSLESTLVAIVVPAGTVSCAHISSNHDHMSSTCHVILPYAALQAASCLIKKTTCSIT